MTTGSINYSPDYKSKFESAMDEGLAANRAAAERERLEREVIEAAKAEIVAADEYEKHLVMANWERSVETRQARQNAVRGLIDFESSQQQIKK